MLLRYSNVIIHLFFEYKVDCLEESYFPSHTLKKTYTKDELKKAIHTKQWLSSTSYFEFHPCQILTKSFQYSKLKVSF